LGNKEKNEKIQNAGFFHLFSMLSLLTKNEQSFWGCAALMTKMLNWPLTFSPKRSEEKHYLEDM